MVFTRLLLKYDLPIAQFQEIERLLFSEAGDSEVFLFREDDASPENPWQASGIEILEDRTELSFEKGDLPNTCFANHEEVMPEFRSTFSEFELLLYVFAQITELGESKKETQLEIPCPGDASDFWEQVQKGREKKEHRSEN